MLAFFLSHILKQFWCWDFVDCSFMYWPSWCSSIFIVMFPLCFDLWHIYARKMMSLVFCAWFHMVLVIESDAYFWARWVLIRGEAFWERVIPGQGRRLAEGGPRYASRISTTGSWAGDVLRLTYFVWREVESGFMTCRGKTGCLCFSHYAATMLVFFLSHILKQFWCWGWSLLCPLGQLCSDVDNFWDVVCCILSLFRI